MTGRVDVSLVECGKKQVAVQTSFLILAMWSAFSLVFFRHLLMLLFTSLYLSDPSGSNLFSLSYTDQELLQDFSSDDVCECISLAVSATAVLKVVITESMSASSLQVMVRGGNIPPSIAWKISNTLGSFSFSR